MNENSVRTCRFCHMVVPIAEFDDHVAEHTRLLGDGQMSDHITLPSEWRYRGALAGIPQTYHHSKCGRSTRMPEDIVRSYLCYPFLYSFSTFCSGCGDYVYSGELRWHDTDEDLVTYTLRLQDEYVREYGPPCLDPYTGRRFRPIRMTERLVEPVLRWLSKHDAGIAVRIRDAESGLQLELQDEFNELRDLRFSSNSVPLVVGYCDLRQLEGVVLDYESLEEGWGFKAIYPENDAP